MTRGGLISVIILMGALSSILFPRIASPPPEDKAKDDAVIKWAGSALPPPKKTPHKHHPFVPH